MISKSATENPKPEHRFSVTLNYELERLYRSLQNAKTPEYSVIFAQSIGFIFEKNRMRLKCSRHCYQSVPIAPLALMSPEAMYRVRFRL